ncbi:MAG: sulfite exporter TauE/SafE family protein [Pyrobaculum sp.]|nr:sulfite exporter TauE/SafE family protein [Pyrobaculum sp.]
MLPLAPLHYVLSAVSGFVVGFTLGLIGGGGSILAIPLLLYFVGLANLGGYSPDYIDHLVVGTTALAVGLNAFINAYMHWRRGNVALREGAVFAGVGAVGSFVGANVGLGVRGELLLFLFGIFMIAVAVYVWKSDGDRGRRASRRGSSWARLVPTAFAVGFASGFFGIGGGFLVVPALLFSTGVDILKAVGTSLISVGTFGMVTATTYLLKGLVEPLISLLYLAGGVAGGYAGARTASAVPRRTLRRIFAGVLIAVAVYIMARNLPLR